MYILLKNKSKRGFRKLNGGKPHICGNGQHLSRGEKTIRFSPHSSDNWVGYWLFIILFSINQNYWSKLILTHSYYYMSKNCLLIPLYQTDTLMLFSRFFGWSYNLSFRDVFLYGEKCLLLRTHPRPKISGMGISIQTNFKTIIFYNYDYKILDDSNQTQRNMSPISSYCSWEE